MASPNILLARDEQLVHQTRVHLKALLVPTLLLFLVAALFGIGLALVPANWNPWAAYVMTGIFVVLVVWLWLLPYLRWFNETYTITTRRIITRKGILNKTGHDLPLRSINNVSYERSVLDRILGCGTLVLETAADNPLKLPDVPKVEQVNVIIADLIFDGEPEVE